MTTNSFSNHRKKIGLILSAYEHSPRGVRAQVLGRYFLCPFNALIEFFPSHGKLLDVGCGHGLMLLLLSQREQGRVCRGIDHSEEKIAEARRLSITNTSFGLEDLEEVPTESYDCLSIVDVLYCTPLQNWRDMLQHCHRVLKTGGRLILKEVTDRPRWKYLLIYLEELIAIRLLRITRGEHPHFESVDTYQRYLEEAGFRCDDFRMLDALRPHAHCLFTATKTGGIKPS